MKTLLVDSNFLCYKAFYSTGNLEYNGVATGITYGFFNQLFKLLEEVNPDRTVFFWDSKKSKRKEIFPGYKNRTKKDQTEEEKEVWKKAFVQFKMLRLKILPQVGLVNNFLQTGFESDDLIAKYVYNKYPDEDTIITATSDDDMLQIINDYSTIYNMNKNKYYDEQTFKDEWGIDPAMWKEVKKLAGCSTDTVPGVPGVKEKTAIKYLTGNLKESHKTYQAIANNKELIDFNEKLVVLPFEGTHDFHDQLQNNKFSMKNFLSVCRDFGFNSFRKEEKRKEIKSLFL